MIAAAGKILEWTLHVSIITWATISFGLFCNMHVHMCNHMPWITILLAICCIGVKNVEILSMFKFQGLSRIQVLKFVIKNVGQYLTDSEEGWPLYLIFYYVLKPNQPITLAAVMLLNAAIRYISRKYEIIEDHQDHLLKATLLLLEWLRAFLTSDITFLSIMTPLYYLLSMSCFSTLIDSATFLPIKEEHTNENENITLSIDSRLDRKIDWYEMYFQLTVFVYFINGCNPVLQMWIIRSSYIFEIVIHWYRTWNNLSSMNITIVKRLTLPLFSIFRGPTIGHTSRIYASYIVNDPAPVAFSTCIHLVISIAAPSRISALLFDEDSCWRVRILFVLTETLRSYLNGSRNSLELIYLILYVISNEVASRLASFQWFRDFIEQIVGKFSVDVEADGIQLKRFSWPWLFVWEQRIQNFLSLAFIFWPSAILIRSFQIFNVLVISQLAIQMVFSLRQRMLNEQDRPIDILIANCAGRIIRSCLFEMQDTLYLGTYQPNPDALAYYYLVYVTFNYLILDVILLRKFKYDIFPIASSSLLRQIDIMLFQICFCVFKQLNMVHLIFWHAFFFALYLVMVWCFQYSWYRLVKMCWRLGSDSQQYQFEPVVVLKTGEGFLADVSHLVVYVGRNTRYDIIEETEAAQVVVRKKVDRSLTLSFFKCLYFPFFRYGLLGITELSEEQVEELSNKNSGHFTSVSRLNKLTTSCQEFALEFSEAVLDNDRNRFLQDATLYRPMKIVNERKTNLKSLVLLLASY